MSNKYIIPFNAPLRKEDSIKTTYGCRQNNPDICGHNGIPGQCAFVSDDHICRYPSRAWKKQFLKLQSEKKDICISEAARR